MSSPFQKNFSAKSPITTSPLKAGGYASGVDGMQYVSPKQPVSNTPKATKATKATKEKENYLEPAKGVDEMEALINKDKDKRDNILFNAANEKIDKAIYDLKNPKMKMKESKKYIKI